ncbi:hypothetical protein K504DRAFT_359261, partial [Pleomassaria siparia CBS 279.74]
FLLSNLFTFFIGQEGKPIVVHAAAIAAASQHLDALINNGMAESETRSAKIVDVEVEDFVRFCEYAYRGDYTVPPWEEVMPELGSSSGMNQQSGGFDTLSGKKKKGRAEPVFIDVPSVELDYPEDAPEDMPYDELVYPEDAPEVMPYDEPVTEAPPEPQYKVRSISRTPLRTQFNGRKYVTDGSPKALILQHFEPQPNTAVDQNFTPVLLAHARLYCFAHLRLIAPLKALTLEKLHKTLLTFKLYAKRIGDIVELVRYVYANPDLPDRSDDGTLDELRKLVVEYIVCEIDTIGEHDVFVKYMEEGGEFVGDFWRMTRGYV